MNSMFLMIIMGYLFILIATFTDLQTKEVPIVISMSYFVTSVVYMIIFNKQNLTDCLISALIICIILSVFVFKANLGGADVIFFVGLAMYVGYLAFYSVIIAFGLSLPYTAYMKVKKREHPYPFLPYILASYVITYIIYFAKLN